MAIRSFLHHRWGRARQQRICGDFWETAGEASASNGLETPRDPERASVELRQRFPIYEAWIIPESRALLRAQWHQAAARASWPLVVVLLVRLRRAPSAINLGVDAPDEAMEPADDEAGAGRPGFVS